MVLASRRPIHCFQRWMHCYRVTTNFAVFNIPLVCHRGIEAALKCAPSSADIEKSTPTFYSIYILNLPNNIRFFALIFCYKNPAPYKAVSVVAQLAVIIATLLFLHCIWPNFYWFGHSAGLLVPVVTLPK